MGPDPPGQQRMRRERLQLKDGFGEFQSKLGLRRGADPTFLGYTVEGSMRLKACSSLGSACDPRETLALWGHESWVPADEDLGAALTTEARERLPWLWVCSSSQEFSAQLQALAGAPVAWPPPHAQVSLTSVGL